MGSEYRGMGAWDACRMQRPRGFILSLFMYSLDSVEAICKGNLPRIRKANEFQHAFFKVDDELVSSDHRSV